MLKPFFPVCASFGPLFIAMGSVFPNRSGPYGFFIAAPGALMTSVALIMIFRALTALESNPSAIKQSIQSKTQESA